MSYFVPDLYPDKFDGTTPHKYVVDFSSLDWEAGSPFRNYSTYDEDVYADKLPKGSRSAIAFELLERFEEGIIEEYDCYGENFYRDRKYNVHDEQYFAKFYRLDEDGDRVSGDPVCTYSLWESDFHKRRFGK